MLFVNTPTLPPLGADTWVHAEIIRCLDRSRFDVHVACAVGPADARTPLYEVVADLPRTHVVPVDFGREHFGERSMAQRLGARLADLRAIPSFVKLARYVRRHRIPVIHTVSRPRDAVASVALARLTGATCLIHMHVGYDPEWMSRPLRWSLRHADGLVAISEFVAGTLTSSGVPRERVHLAYNGLVLEDWTPPTDRHAARAELALPAAGPLVVSVSRLFPSKGTAELVRAIAIVRRDVPDVRLVVIGRDVSGSGFMAQLEQIVVDEDLADHVMFVGQRPDVSRYMGAADVFAMPSFGEPFGLVFLEAMAMEVPVVALNNGASPEVVDDGKAGLLSDPGDITSLAANLVTLLTDPDLRSRMGTYGRQQVAARFTVEQLASAMGGIYETVAP